jgi:UDP-N-acetylglucosamine--N-acetylmuramyl-(pentapeptide) pyrophosphoryl-undecaprenol N-acetylglucosamine transferase
MVAVADALSALDASVRPVFVGTGKGQETRIVPERGYELCLVRVSPLRGAGLGGALRGVAQAARALPEARALLRRLQPRAVFSIGGYAAGPVSLMARARGIPLALHEPNTVIGLANRLIAPLVQRAYLAFPEAERHFAADAIVRSGVPLRAGFRPRPYARAGASLRILVLGGSQGAEALNQVLPEALARARVAVEVVHQAGRGNERAVAERYRRLGAQARARVVPFIDDMPSAIGQAELVLGRAGASALAEICAIGRPSLLVPYPHAAGDHQRLNAESLQRDGAAVCVVAAEASAERLAAEVDRLATTPGLLEQMAEAARGRGRPDAAREIALDLLRLAGLGAGDGEGRAAGAGGTGAAGERSEARAPAEAP